MAIEIGCGSWADAAYAGLLYPRGFPPEMRLSGYAMWFNRVEVNATYYAFPRAEAVAKWVALTPPSFVFDIRLHQVFSRSPLKAGQGPLFGRMLAGLQPLLRAKRLGIFLLVLPPTFGPGRHKLEELDPLVEKVRPHSLAVELRDAAWVAGQARAATLDYFRKRKLTWVSVDMPRIAGSKLMPPVDEVTQPKLAYLRLHGRNPKYLEAKSAAERHIYAYPEGELRELAERIRQLARKADTVRVVANNHAFDFAPKTALALQEFLGTSPWQNHGGAATGSAPRVRHAEDAKGLPIKRGRATGDGRAARRR